MNNQRHQKETIMEINKNLPWLLYDQYYQLDAFYSRPVGDTALIADAFYSRPVGDTALIADSGTYTKENYENSKNYSRPWILPLQ